MEATRDQNGNPVHYDIRRERLPDGTWAWGCNVWFGSGCITNERRYYYATRAQARIADIGDDFENSGRVA